MLHFSQRFFTLIRFWKHNVKKLIRNGNSISNHQSGHYFYSATPQVFSPHIKFHPWMCGWRSPVLQAHLTPWRWGLLQKVTVTQLIKKFPAFMEPVASLSYSQELTTGLYPVLDESSPHPKSSHPYPGLPNGLFPKGFPTKILYVFLPHVLHVRPISF